MSVEHHEHPPDTDGAVRDHIAIASAGKLKFSELDSFLIRFIGKPVKRQDPNASYPGLGFVARADGDLIGIALFYFIQSTEPGEDLCFLTNFVDPLYRRRGVGRRLMDEVLNFVEQRNGKVSIIVSLSEEDTRVCTALLSRFGFVEIDSELRYERNLVRVQPRTPDPSFSLHEYKGGDPSLDRAILDLHLRAYRFHPCVAKITEDLLAMRLADPNWNYELMFHEGKLVGYASLWCEKDGCYIDNLLISQHYWGSGASDNLVILLEDMAIRRGFATAWAMCRSSNRPIIRLMEAHGFRSIRTTRRFCKRFSGAAA
ncbi:MAG: GNAT family N-acetyltransferase [Terracidiphilus sp.]